MAVLDLYPRTRRSQVLPAAAIHIPVSRRVTASTLALATALALHGVVGHASAEVVDVVTLAAVQSAAQSRSGAGEARRQFDIPAGTLKQGIGAFGAQTRLQLVYAPDALEGKTTSGVVGRYTLEEAIQRLLAGTGLTWEFVGDAVVTIKSEGLSPAAEPKPVSQSQSRKEKQVEDERVVGMPAIMVEGARTLNVDITRTRDDPQPYVVFDRDLIERSGATSLEQFLQQRLPMNTSVGSVGSGMRTDVSYMPAASGISLRGLGSAQTLILVDGHRMSSPSVMGASTQGEISGIPLASIERIEILPSTASGIYGGSATGGVINIITRKDYQGGEVRITYDNTFSSDSAIRKLDFVFGQNFNEGRTNLLLSAGYSDANELLQRDRGLFERGRSQILNNNPDRFLLPTNAPFARTPNFTSADGSNLVLKSGLALGSPFASVPLGYGGVATDGGATLAATAGGYNWDLPSGSLGLGQTLYTEPTVKSGTLVLRHQFSESLQGFADLSASETRRRYNRGGSVLAFLLPATSPYNPFTTPVRGRAVIPDEAPQEMWTERERAVVGLIKQLPRDWLLSLDYTWDRTKLGYTAGNALPWNSPLGGLVSGGAVDILRDLEAHPIDASQYLIPAYFQTSQSTMKDTSLRVSGPLGNLPGGRPVLSTALAYREEAIPDTVRSNEPNDNYLYPARSTSVSSAYLEYRVPLFSERNARPGLRELELQLAARYEDYVSRSGQNVYIPGEVPSPLPETPVRVKNEFSSVDPTVALRWKPFQDLVLRASYGTGFTPPSLRQLVPVTIQGHVNVSGTDPRRGNSSLPPYALTYSGNDKLQPEQSKSWSAGLIFTPTALSGLRLSLDYTRIEKTDNILSIPGSHQGVLDNEALFPDLVIRGPNLDSDPPGWAGPVVHLKWIPVNLASAEVEAWDFQLDYRLDTQTRGSFDLFLVGTLQTRYAIQLIDGAPVVDYVGVGGVGNDEGDDRYPLEFKANVGLTWNLSAWRAGWNMSYFDSYQATATNATILADQGRGGRVSSQTYHDLFASYDFGLSGGNVPQWLLGIQVQLGVRNVFNREPPFDAANTNLYYSQFGSPRLASYYLTVTKRF